MENIKVLSLLNMYFNLIENNEIQFLSSESHIRNEIKKNIVDLKSDFQEAEKTAKEKQGEVSEYLDWAKTHEHGRDLWKNLASAALSGINPASKGNSKLLDFLKAATEFEDLLYGLEQHYRDHTLHSLWVYFIGEYILREQIPELSKNLNWYLINDIESDKQNYGDPLIRDANKKERDLCKRVNEKKDSIWCLIALCHDLGYSLSKLGKLNEKAKNVLDFFDIPDSTQIGYSLDVEHQFLVSQFLELMAMEVRIVPSMDLKEVLVKSFRDDSLYWRLCKSFEKKQHGILSSYLIYKILEIFADAYVRGPAEEWGLDDFESIQNLILGDILYSIAQHTFDYTYIDTIGGFAEILMLADELEEFSRYGRKMLSRKYYDTAAEAKIEIKKSKYRKQNIIDIEIVHEVAHSWNMSDFFVKKVHRFCQIFSLSQHEGEDSQSSKYFKIRSISITTVQKDLKCTFVLKNDSTYEGHLPKSRDENYEAGIFAMKFSDDKIVVIAKGNEIPLKDWFKIDVKE
jgi:hypothetical protein